MRKLGVPYKAGVENDVHNNMSIQATEIAQNILKDLNNNNYTQSMLEGLKKKEIVALIAYLPKAWIRYT